MSDRFALLEITVAREEEFVEQFKWQNALLRNSWSYFAQKSGTLSRGGALTVAAGNGLSRTADRLLPAMLQVQHPPRRAAIDPAPLDRKERVVEKECVSTGRDRGALVK